MDQDEEEWNPSWSDEEEDAPEPSTQDKNNYRKKERDKSKALKAACNDSDSDTDKETQRSSNSKDGCSLKSSPDSLSDTNLFRRKFYNKEELFKNLAGRQHQSKGGFFQQNFVHGEQSSKLNKDINYKRSNTVQLNISSKSKTVERTLITFETVAVGSKSNDLKCNECGKRFAKKIHLTLHQKIHARMDNSLQLENIQDDIEYQCSVCKQVFETNHDLIGHNEKNHPTRLQPNETPLEFLCEKCDRRFDRGNQLKFHRRICKAVSKNAFSVKDPPPKPEKENHEHNQNKPSEFVCEKCDRSFERSNQLKLHGNLCKAVSKNTSAANGTPPQPAKQNNELNKQRLNKESPDFVCDKCDRRFDRNNQLKFHRRMCKAISKNTLPVKDTPLQPAKKNHEQDLNKESSAFVCEKCDRRFERSNQLKFHRKLCKDISKNNSSTQGALKPVKHNYEQRKCEDNSDSSVDRTICDTTVKFWKAIKSHYTNFPMQNQSKVCNVCGTTVNETEFEKHVKSCTSTTKTLHSTPKKVTDNSFNCITCGKTFTDQVALIQHRMLHKYSIESFEDISSTDFNCVLPFACQQVDCKSRFSNEFDLDFHRERKHGIRTFSNPVYYHIHDSQHPPLNPYVLLTHEIKETAETKWKAISQTRKNTPRVLKRRFKKLRGRQPRFDIPFQNFYVCETCDRKFIRRNRFLIHIAAHKREEKYSCNFCEKKFQSKSLLETHIERHSDPSYDPKNAQGRFRHDIPFQDVYTCETCGEKFDQRNLFLIHLLHEKFKCTICDRKFQSKSLLEVHTKRHSDPAYVYRPGRVREDIPFQDVYTCEACGEKFVQRNLYLLHLREEKFKCTMCGRRFQSEALLEAHVKRHEDPSYDPNTSGQGRFRHDIPIQDIYTCTTCQKSFNKRNIFLSHLSVHERVEKFKCSTCDRGFLSESLLQSHMERHSDPTYVHRPGRVREDIPFQDVYTCEACGEKFVQRNLYLLHLREEKFKCTMCGRRFQSEALLEAHVKRHEDPSYDPNASGPGRFRHDIPIQDVYTCATCQRSFNKRNFYLSHLSCHEREEKFKCTICDRRFQSKTLLEAHTKRHEDPSYVPGQRRFRSDVPIQSVYKCEKCDRSFTSRQRYICHLNYHKTAAGANFTGKRRPRRKDIPIQDVYFCGICNRQFSDRKKYIFHLYIHEKTGKGAQFVGKGGRRRRLDIPVQDVYYCEHCNYKKSFTERIKYILHLRQHGLTKRHKCDGCLKMFKTTNARDIHRDRFCKNIPCKFKCERCGDRFHNKLTLQRHFQRFHSKILESAEPEIEYPCNQCSQTFNTTFGLTRHNQIYHPQINVTLESEAPNFAHVSADNNDSSHSWDAEEYNPMLAVSYCEAELNEEVSAGEKSNQIKTMRRKLPPPGRIFCQCGITKKYKSQKFCHSKRCPCVVRGDRCSTSCDCDSGCLNSNELEVEQQQKFKEGRDSMMEMESPPHGTEELCDSTPIVIDYTDDAFDESESYPVIQSQPVSSSSLGYNKLIPSSEFITVGDSQDESMRQLSLEGYVEGAEDFDPLGDPLVEEEPQLELGKPFSLANTSGLKQSLEVQKSCYSTMTVSHTTPSASGSTSSAVSASMKINTEAGVDGFNNQSANLRCQFCKKNFKVIPVYISHILNHDLEKANFTLSCPICLKEFAHQVTSFCQHLNVHNRGINLQCTKCSSKFQTYNDMEQHLKVHHFRPMECGICEAKFSNSQLMMSHWSKVHPTCQCGLCSLKFFSHDDLTFHMKSLHSPYDCLRCNERFENLDELLAHYTKHHTATIFPEITSQNSKFNFKCTHCSDSFASGEDLNEHLSNHLADQVKRRETNQYPTNQYQCDQCKATFTTPEDLHDHLAHHIMGSSSTTTVHPQQHSSNFNNNRSSSTGTYNRFSASTRDVEVEIIEDVVVNDNIQAVEVLTCPKCGKGFQNKNGWRLHLTSHKLLICSACDSSYETKEELLNHLQINSCVVHFCEICSRNFQAKKYLSQHMKFVHDGEKRSSTSATSRRKQLLVPLSTGNAGFPTSYGQAVGTSSNAQTVVGDSFPVIVASTSLAQSRSSPVQPTTYIVNNGNNLFTSQRLTVRPQPQPGSQIEIEEIVLD